jgi:hypothetical protein
MTKAFNHGTLACGLRAIAAAVVLPLLHGVCFAQETKPATT